MESSIQGTGIGKMSVKMESESEKVPSHSAKDTTCAFDRLFTKNVPHIHEKIFFSLDYKSYKTCMKVSKAWNELLLSEFYQKKSKTVFHKDILEEMKQFINACKKGDKSHLIEDDHYNLWIFTLISLSVALFFGCLFYFESYEASLN